MEEEDGERELTELQREIDAQLDKDKKRRKPTKMVAPILPACREKHKDLHVPSILVT